MSKTEKASKVLYSEIKPIEAKVDLKKYMRFLKIYHTLRPYLQRENKTTKAELVKLFPKDKSLAEQVWICVFELKLVWAKEIFDRLD